MKEANERKTLGSDTEHTPTFAKSGTWGTGGSFVFDPVTGERLTEAEWAQRQDAARPDASTASPAPTNPSTTKPSKGA